MKLKGKKVRYHLMTNKVSCNGCLNFTESIGMRIKRDADKIDFVAMSQFCKSYNLIILLCYTNVIINVLFLTNKN